MAHRKALVRRQLQVLVRSGQWINVPRPLEFSGGDSKAEPEQQPMPDGSTKNLGADRTREAATYTILADEHWWAIAEQIEEVDGEPDNIRLVCTPLNDRRNPLAGGRTYTLTGGLAGVSETETKVGDNSAATIALGLALNVEKVWT